MWSYLEIDLSDNNFVKSGKLVLNPYFLLWACLIPDEDPIPLIQWTQDND